MLLLDSLRTQSTPCLPACPPAARLLTYLPACLPTRLPAALIHPVAPTHTHTHTHTGKSTLLGLISGELEPTKGHVYRNPKVGGWAGRGCVCGWGVGVVTEV